MASTGGFLIHLKELAHNHLFGNQATLAVLHVFDSLKELPHKSHLVN